MGVGISKQIGWSQEANLLYEILRELDYLNLVTADATGNCVCPTTTTSTTIYLCTGEDVTIGSQVWKVCNLNVSTYNNGDPIPEITDLTEWVNATTGAWCWYNNDSANGAIYGKLYNWYAVTDPRGIAPAGYHVPSESEWQALSFSVIGDGGTLKETGTTHWTSPNTGATNSTGFTALPGGIRGFDGSFSLINDYGFWWTSTPDVPGTSRNWALAYDISTILFGNSGNNLGFSVRLIKD
jgi:uncharacterized protein (TIGR02145 family)